MVNLIWLRESWEGLRFRPCQLRLLPITTVEDRFPGLLLVDRIYLRCATLNDVAPVAVAITGEVQQHESIEELEIGVSWKV